MPCGAKRDLYHIERMPCIRISNLPQGKYIEFANGEYIEKYNSNFYKRGEIDYG